MRTQLLAFMISFSMVFSPWVSFAMTPANPNLCDQVLHVEDLDITQDLIAATHEYLKTHPKVDSNSLVAKLKKSFKWMNPIRTLNYFRGESEPDSSTFRIYTKKVVINGEQKEQVVFMVGLPKIMKKGERKRLEDFASHFQRFGIPQIDPKIERKDFSLKFFNDEFGFFSGLGLWSVNKIMKIWDFSTHKLPRWLFIHSLPLPLPMPKDWRPYQLPLSEDLKNFKIKIVEEDGSITLKKIKMDPREGQLLYLLNKHRPNVVEAMDKFGGDARSVLVLTFIFSAISDVLHTLDSGINQLSEYGTIMPVVALAASRLIAATLNALQDERIPKLNPKNIYIAAKKFRILLKDLIFHILKKEKEDPSSSAEEVFEKYKWEVEKDDYWQKAIIALFGYEPIKRDGAVIYSTKTIGKNMRVVTQSESIAERQLQEALSSYIKTINELEPTKDLSAGNFFIEFSDRKNLPGSTHTQAFKVAFDEQLRSIDGIMNKFSNEPIFVMLDNSQVNGFHHQMLQNLGFANVLAEPKISEPKDPRLVENGEETPITPSLEPADSTNHQE